MGHRTVIVAGLCALLPCAIPAIGQDRLIGQVLREVGKAKEAPAARNRPAPEPKPRRRPRPGRVLPSPGDPATLRAAVEDLIATFGTRYPRGPEYLARLAGITRRFSSGQGAEEHEAQAEFESLQREALAANPLVSGRPILFVVRRQYQPDHHNTATLFQTGEINTAKFAGPGALKAIDLAAGGKVRTLVDVPGGVVRDPDVSFDGGRVLFAMRRNAKDDYHLYEVNADGSGLEQLTFGSAVSDIDPLYLPDGRIAFSSSREPKFCMCNRHIMCNLFRMDADGANIHQIGKSTLFEGHGAILPDGRIVYDRWEYVDRNFGDAQGVWTCNPDGTNHAVYYGNNTASPGAVLDARALPDGAGERFIATYSSCHDRPWGALAVVERTRGLDSPGPEVRVWPAGAAAVVGRGNYDAFTRVRPKYEDPCPLGGKHFLCSRMTGRGEEMGIYLLDVFGNEVCLHAEEPGCYDPMPLGPRRRPPVIPDRVRLDAAEGRLYVHDVYIGTGMQRVARGTVKYLRVVESPEKHSWTQPNWQGSGTQAPGMAWDDFNNKRILGTATVEPDGSAYFAVPADRFVYFQLLDADGMMVQSMRSGTIVRPGEATGCAGCHEDRLTAVANRPVAATRRPPEPLRPWYGPPREFNYLREVQPVLDRHCIRCHDYGKPGAKKVVLAGDLGLIFNASYVELRSKKLVTVPGAGPARALPPSSWGSHASRLVEVLRKGHNKVTLDAEAFDRIVTWIDINAPYYPFYASAYRDNPYGRSPLTGQQLSALARLGVNLSGRDAVTQVSFDRPERSRCLAAFRDKADPRYVQALAVIRAGKEMLARRPRAEMPGFKLIGLEAQREARYRACLDELAEMRSAIVAGRKRYGKRD